MVAASWQKKAMNDKTLEDGKIRQKKKIQTVQEAHVPWVLSCEQTVMWSDPQIFLRLSLRFRIRDGSLSEFFSRKNIH